MNRALIVPCVTNEEAETFGRCMGCDIVSADCVQARKMIFSEEFELILILISEKKHNVTDFAVFAAENTYSGIIAAASEKDFEAALKRLEPYGVFVIKSPFKGERLRETVRLLKTAAKRYPTLLKQNRELHGRLDEVKLIGRAKCLLMENLKMSEKQAHRYIEKQAMDMRESRAKIAENILKTYQT